ncbi:MAG: outer membrane beta-barrel protein [Alphaproteobacteria bacterium GM202ARS2]|nr:outer membrane beta-barrel protein [Alphaproteobacteria bacterium GM202ARS2]
MNNKLTLLVALFAGMALCFAPQGVRADVEPEFEEFEFEEFDDDFEEEEFEEEIEEMVEEEFEEMEVEEQIGGCILDTEARLGVLCDTWSTRIIGRMINDALFINSDSENPGAFSPRSSAAGVRAARLGIAGTLYKDWIYKLEYDFALRNPDGERGQLSDAYLGYKGIRDFVFRVGNMKAVYNLDQAGDARFDLFMESIFSDNPYGYGKPRYPGIAVSYTRDKRLSANLGAHMAPYNANEDADGADDVAVYGRITYAPYMENYWYTHVGFGGKYYNYNGSNPENRFRGAAPFSLATIDSDEVLYDTNGSRDLDNGSRGFVYDYRYTVSFDAAGGWRNYGGQAGVTRVVQEPTSGSSIEQYAFYAQANWWLTGERNNYLPEQGVFGRVVPVRRLGSGGLGAIGVAVRYHQLILDSSETPTPPHANVAYNEGGRVWGITAGITWKPNPYVKLIGEYVYVDRDRFACGSVVGADDDAAVACRGGDTPRAVQFRAQMDF